MPGDRATDNHERRGLTRGAWQNAGPGESRKPMHQAFDGRPEGACGRRLVRCFTTAKSTSVTSDHQAVRSAVLRKRTVARIVSRKKITRTVSCVSLKTGS